MTGFGLCLVAHSVNFGAIKVWVPGILRPGFGATFGTDSDEWARLVALGLKSDVQVMSQHGFLTWSDVGLDSSH